MTIKQERMMDRVREILSGLLLLEVTDPALQGVTVTDVVMDRELEFARVFVNALGEEERQAEVMAGLKRANGFLRRELGKRVRLRRVPVLHFEWDTSFSRAEAIETKLDQVRAELREKDAYELREGQNAPASSSEDSGTEDGE